MKDTTYQLIGCSMMILSGLFMLTFIVYIIHKIVF